MIITCPCGDKKFNVDASLIPKEGRNLQCGFCDRKWFYTLPKKSINDDVLEPEGNGTSKEKSANYDEGTFSKDFISNDKDEIDVPNKSIKTFNFKILFFYLILIIALIILVDTFKSQISSFYPNINNIMNSLYETLKDLKLFFIDLIR
jgi:hypothetical protein|tara:strand:+ start:72 stop:515 length:444 start_codon:yes stop_codon:yes gene_type:complete